MEKRASEERTVEVPKGDDSYNKACEEVKNISGFSEYLFLRSKLKGSTVEYQFIVGNDLNILKADLFSRQLEAERVLR